VVEDRSEEVELAAVRRVLDGEQATEIGGYPLIGPHVAAVAWGAKRRDCMRLLAWELSGELLSVDADAETAWGWIGVAGTNGDALRTRLRGYSPSAGGVAVGAAGTGSEGFREAHQRALAAARVARLSAANLTLYEDVALEALALADVEAARRFVHFALGGLADDDPRARELRATLRTYLACGQSATSAAAMLDVHERTIGNRLRAAEGRLGRSVVPAHAELELALRLHELLID